MITKAIFGIKYSYLSNEEILFIKKYHPYGIIFFERNIESINQFKSLINHIKSLVNYDLLFVIDHEGGKINRFNKIFSQKKYSARYFGEMYNKDRKKYKKELDYFLNFNVNLFKLLGINTVAYPVMDILYRKTHKIIKDRCFSSEKKQIVKIAKYVINFYQSNKISCISKHAPGHGLSTKDSHLSLPVVTENKKFLMKNDFETFKNIKSHYMMTAHIHYKNFDKKCATYSKHILQDIIKKKLNFRGKIITDDICMKGLKGNLKTRSIQPLIAGCDLILHCNGNMNEMLHVAKYVRSKRIK